MDKQRAVVVVIVFLACGLVTPAFAQPKFNSNADDVGKIGNLLDEFLQDISHKDGADIKKLLR